MMLVAQASGGGGPSALPLQGQASCGEENAAPAGTAATAAVALATAALAPATAVAPATAAVAPARTADLAVGLCGRAARVPLRPEEGLGELRARVAGAFGLAAPFELLACPEGTPLRCDADAARAAAAAVQAQAAGEGSGHGAPVVGAAAPQVTVAASEDALLDLERAHGESGALRWALLRQLLSGQKTQIAEAFAAISESKHQAAKFDEQLLWERTARETGDASLYADVQALAGELRAEARRGRQELRTALALPLAELEQRFEKVAGQQEAALCREVEALRAELQGEREDRQRQGDEARRCVEELRAGMKRWLDAHGEAEDRSASVAQALRRELGEERGARLAAEERSAKAQESVAAQLRGELAQVRDLTVSSNAQIANVQASVEDARAEARALLEARASQWETELEGFADRIAQAARASEEQLTAHRTEARSYIDGRLAEVGDAEPLVRELAKEHLAREASALVAQETAARQAAVQQLRGELESVLHLPELVQQEAAERRACLDRALTAATAAAKAAAEATAEAAAEAAAVDEAARQTALEEALAVRDEELRSLQGRLEAEARGLTAEVAALRMEVTGAHEAAHARVESDLEVLRACFEEIRAAGATRAAELLSELQGLRETQANDCSGLAQQLEACEVRLSTDLRAGAAGLAELRQHCEGLVRDALASARAELAEEARRLEACTVDLGKTHAAVIRPRHALRPRMSGWLWRRTAKSPRRLKARSSCCWSTSTGSWRRGT